MVDGVAVRHAEFVAAVRRLHGKVLATALDDARILREFTNDDRAAWRALRSGLKRHSSSATTLEVALASAALVELDAALGEDAAEHGEQLRAL